MSRSSNDLPLLDHTIPQPSEFLSFNHFLHAKNKLVEHKRSHECHEGCTDGGQYRRYDSHVSKKVECENSDDKHVNQYSNGEYHANVWNQTHEQDDEKSHEQ